MEELYIENFSVRAKAVKVENPPTHTPFNELEKNKRIENELFFQITLTLNQLERWVIEQNKEDEGLQYLLAKIKRKVTDRCFTEVIALLNKLEELLDLNLTPIKN